MKKFIILLLGAQLFFYTAADSGCMGYKKIQGSQGVDNDPSDPLAWRWGVKSPKHIKCYCNCEQYPQAHGKCIMCGHKRIPKALQFSNDQKKSSKNQSNKVS